MKEQICLVVLLVIADCYAYRQTEQLHQGMRTLGILNNFELEEMERDNNQLYEMRGKQFHEGRCDSLCTAMFHYFSNAENPCHNESPIFNQKEERKV